MRSVKPTCLVKANFQSRLRFVCVFVVCCVCVLGMSATPWHRPLSAAYFSTMAFSVVLANRVRLRRVVPRVVWLIAFTTIRRTGFRARWWHRSIVAWREKKARSVYWQPLHKTLHHVLAAPNFGVWMEEDSFASIVVGVGLQKVDDEWTNVFPGVVA